MLSYKDNRYDSQEVFLPLLCFLELEAALTVLSRVFVCISNKVIICVEMILTCVEIIFQDYIHTICSASAWWFTCNL